MNIAATPPFKFLARPGYHTQELLVEFCGDHRVPEYPDVPAILEQALQAQMKPVSPETSLVGIATDCYSTSWSYPGGEYQVDEDTFGLFIHAPENNRTIMADLEKVLVESGLFLKEEVDFSNYA